MMTTRVVIVALLAIPYTAGLILVFAMARRTRQRLAAARKAQRESQLYAASAAEKLSGVLEGMKEGFLIIDSEWRITYVNSRGEQLLGASRGLLIGRDAAEYVADGRRSQICEDFKRAIRERTTAEFETWYPPTNRWLEVRGFPAEDGTSTVYLRDISKKKHAQEALSLQARMLDTVGQAVIGIGPDDLIFYWNRAAADLFGWERPEVEGRKTKSIIGGVLPGERMLTKRDGSVFPALILDTKLTDDRGDALGTVRVVSDLSDRMADQQAQRFLATAGSDLTSTLDFESLVVTVGLLAVPTLGDCCFLDVMQEEGASRRIESAWAASLAASGERRVSHHLYDTSVRAAALLHNGETTIIPKVTDEILRTAVVDADELARLRVGNLKSMIVAPLKAGGRLLGTITIGSIGRVYNETDANLATEFARRIALAADNALLYETARVASKAKSDFLAVMSHELRTPLTTVMGYTDLLLAGVSGALTPQSKLYTERIKSAAMHLLRLIEQILIYTRTEVGREQIRTERVLVDHVLRDAAALIEPVAMEKGLTFEWKPPQHTGYINTDTTKLRQVLVNLLSNAVKFTDKGDVVLEAHLTDTKVEFKVHDTGIGIAPEHLERVFDSFWQVDQSSTRRVGGTGLGLSVARRLARLLGGDVAVASSSGVGTTFVVTLPRAIRVPVHGRQLDSKAHQA